MIKETKVVIKETTTSIIDDDGVHLKSQNTQKSIVSREPQYIKLYLQDIIYLNDLPKWLSQVLYSLLKLLNYDNEIYLNAELRKRISEELEIKPQTLNDAILKLNKSKILVKIGSGTYIANPMLFGKGEWLGIRTIRLKVEYDFNLGTKNISTEIESINENEE
jgi:hypothetical protein